MNPLQLRRGETKLVRAELQLVARVILAGERIPIRHDELHRAVPDFRAAVRETQSALAASQIDRGVVGENKSSELFDRIADYDRVREAARSGISDPVLPGGITDDPVASNIDVADAQYSAEKLVARVKLRTRLTKPEETKRVADRQYAAVLMDNPAV